MYILLINVHIMDIMIISRARWHMSGSTGPFGVVSLGGMFSHRFYINEPLGLPDIAMEHGH